MATNTPLIPPESDAHLRRLLLEDTNKGWFSSLRENLIWLFKHNKEPPLVVTSKPVPVRDIWGEYRYGRISGPASVAVHIAIVAILIVSGRVLVKHVPPNPITKLLETVLDPGPYIPQAAKDLAGGGGGGGDRSPLPASRGRLPRLAMEQLTPPTVIIRNENPALAVEPTVIVPPDAKIPQPNVAWLGDPLSGVTGPLSSGPGRGGGIGDGKDGGVGRGDGPGFGPGKDGGTGGFVFRPGVGGVSPPQLVFKIEPEYSEEARKARLQGTVLLNVVVGADGRVLSISVASGLGLGLDQKAIEAVKQWKFIPGQKDGKPVPVAASVEVLFRLL